ncbi:MAG: ABC transporter substrate-binding protein, partial [Frankia sp.]|nr:ABC transporter substrate-binding protein [Frankia sp.]
MALVGLLTVSCSGSGGGPAAATPPADPVTGTLRLGYSPDLTQAPALYGLSVGLLVSRLGTGVHLRARAFESTDALVAALRAGTLDAAYVPAGAAAAAYLAPGGEQIRIVSGAAASGARFVVRADIADAAGLRGQPVATPGLGSSEDVALRWYLRARGLAANPDGSGDVSVRPMSPDEAVDAFTAGMIAGAWRPAPAAMLMVADGGRILVDEAAEWPVTGGRFATTVLVTRADYLADHRDIVARLVAANVAVIDELNAEPQHGAEVVNRELAIGPGERLPVGVLASAWESLAFTPDPISISIAVTADRKAALGLAPAPAPA